MKRRLYSKIKIFMALAIFAFTSASAQVASGVNGATFSLFSSSYDYTFDPLYSLESTPQKFEVQTGFFDDYLNLGTAFMAGPAEVTFNYYQRITNYKAWWDNLTDEGLCVMASFPSLNAGIYARYFDQCYYNGKGRAQPGAGIFKTFDSVPLRLSLDADSIFCSIKGNTTDLIQYPVNFRAEYSKDRQSGIGLEYTIMFTTEGKENETDISGLDPLQTFGGWAAKEFSLSRNASVAARVQGHFSVNALNTADDTTILNVPGGNKNRVPKNGQKEGLLQVPFGIKYVCGKNQNVELYAAMMFGFYWSNFDHYSTEHEGGYNGHGWVPQTGMGFAARVELTPNAAFQAGSSFIRMPQVADKDDSVNYTAEHISLSSIFDSPLSASLSLKF